MSATASMSVLSEMTEIAAQASARLSETGDRLATQVGRIDDVSQQSVARIEAVSRTLHEKSEDLDNEADKAGASLTA